MVCKYCGAQVEADWRFCENCGAKVEAPAEPAVQVDATESESVEVVNPEAEVQEQDAPELDAQETVAEETAVEEDAAVEVQDEDCTEAVEGAGFESQGSENFPVYEVEHKTSWLTGKVKAIIAICVASVVVLCGIVYFSSLETNYGKAIRLINSGTSYAQAKEILKGISFYKDSRELMKECDYQQAKELARNEKYKEAQDFLNGIAGYKDTSELLEYVKAGILKKDGKVLEAYDAYEKLGAYMDSAVYKQQLRDLMFSQGAALYKTGSYEQAKTYLEKYNETDKHSSGDMTDAQKYLKLIEVRQTTLDDVSELYDLIDFADTKEILMSDQYLQKFLMGAWSSGSEIICYYEDDTAMFSLPSVVQNPSPSYFVVAEREHRIGTSGANFYTQFEYEILNKDTIRVHCCADDNTYYFQRM